MFCSLFETLEISGNKGVKTLGPICRPDLIGVAPDGVSFQLTRATQ
jgi:hypothetical protein